MKTAKTTPGTVPLTESGPNVAARGFCAGCKAMRICWVRWCGKDLCDGCLSGHLPHCATCQRAAAIWR